MAPRPGSSQRLCRSRRAAWLVACLALVSAASGTTETRLPGERRYEAGPLRRWLLGANWRDLWSTPIELAEFDLGEVGGGLQATRTVGGHQTQGLALDAPGGRSFTFRSLAKANFVPGYLRWRPARQILSDQSSGNFPAADLVTAFLARHLGIPMTERRLGVMPDDPRLGRFREDFAGRVGTLSEFPLAGPDGAPGTFGAVEIIATETLWERARAGDAASVDARAYLRARLLDWWTADFDRHPEQWRWARIEGRRGFVPLSEDHDHAFPRYQGVVAGVARWGNPWLLAFDEDYSLEGLVNNSRALDAWILVGLDREVWEEEVADFVARAREGGLARRAAEVLPERWREIAGAEIAENLERRLDGLPDFAVEVYDFLAMRIALHGSDGADLAEFACREDERLHVAFHRGDDPVPIERALDPTSTRRIEVFWYGGDDRIARIGERVCGIEVVEFSRREPALERGVPVPPDPEPRRARPIRSGPLQQFPGRRF